MPKKGYLHLTNKTKRIDGMCLHSSTKHTHSCALSYVYSKVPSIKKRGPLWLACTPAPPRNQLSPILFLKISITVKTSQKSSPGPGLIGHQILVTCDSCRSLCVGVRYCGWWAVDTRFLKQPTVTSAASLDEPRLIFAFGVNFNAMRMAAPAL